MANDMDLIMAQRVLIHLPAAGDGSYRALFRRASGRLGAPLCCPARLPDFRTGRRFILHALREVTS